MLARTKFRRYATLVEVTVYVKIITDRSDRGPDPCGVPSRSRDRKDDYLLALAVETEADSIVSGDDDLLTLSHSPSVVSPRAFLDAIGHAG